MVPVLQMREFMAERVDQARILQQVSAPDLDQSDLDRAIVEARSPPTLDAGAFGFDDAEAQSERLGDLARVAIQSRHDAVARCSI